VLAVVGSVLLAACSGGSTSPSPAAGGSAPPQTPSATSTVDATYYRLVQYPDSGFSGFYAQTAAAQHTIDMEMYELADTTEEAALAAAAARHVTVRVLLDYDFSGHAVNQPAYDYLTAHGVQVRWAPTGVIFHIKATTFDGATADISTANLTSKYYADTRDAGIVDTDPAQVKAVEQTFDGDWNLGSAGRPNDDASQVAGLIWSPITGDSTAQTALVDQIAAARQSVYFESEELSDAPVYNALAAAAKRGVNCEVVMTDATQWHSALATLAAAGCHARTYPNRSGTLYIHEKLILDDAGTPDASLLLGSQNASSSSLTRNRELGLLLTAAQAPAVLTAVAATFSSDYSGATAWGSTPAANPAPGPTAAASHPTSTGANSCTPLTNAGNCYRPGEQCRTADRGSSGIDAAGQPITCREDSGWRWETS
jgi:phosphatidylserine/phosphatidylglycerophosphate/cardiolipin synthase-like enzyme